MKTKATKTNIIGFILIIMGALALAFALVPFVVSIVGGGLINITNRLVFLYLVVGIYSIIEGSAIRGRKKWAWYVGVITFGMGFISNLIAIFFSPSLQLVLVLLCGGFVLYSLVSEKEAFLIS